jgi:hypothetical protein
MNLTAKLIIVVIVLISIAIAPIIQNEVEKSLFNQKYFFIQDPDFVNWGVIRYWYPFTWNSTSSFTGFAKYANGTYAHLFYNDTGASDGWGAGAVFLQGKHPHQGYEWRKIFAGTSKSNAKEVEYVKFRRDIPIPKEKFFLLAKVKVLRRNYTVFKENDLARSQVGVDLMFGFDDKNYDDPDLFNRVAIHVDILLSKVIWDKATKTPVHERILSHVDYLPEYDDDYHLTLVRGKIEQLNQWYTFKLDLAEIIETIFKLLPIQKLRLYGILVYTDGISSYTEVIYDYVKTALADP